MLVSFLCMAFAVQAETVTVTDLSQLSNEKVYTLRSARAFLMYSSALKGQICSSTGKVVGDVTQDPNDVNQQFRIEQTNGNYYLYSVAAEKYVDSNGNYAATATAAITFENVGGEYPWKLVLGGKGMNSQISGQTNEGIIINDWLTTDAGNCYKIEEAVIKERT